MAIYNKIREDAKSRGKYVEFISFSKLEKYLKCKKCFKYLYIDKVKQDFKDNLHADVGTLCHDIIEWSSIENWSREKIIKTFRDRSIIACDKFGMNTNIPLITSIRHFFEKSNFMHDLYNRGVKLEFEVPVYRKLKYKENSNKEYWIVGFIDMVIHNEDGSISIIDFKTSNISGYTGKKKEQAFLQIYSYAYIYEAMYRKEIKDVGYLFIKYCNMSFKDYKGKTRKSSKVERKNIKEEFSEKGGECDLVIRDCIEMYSYNKDNRLIYIKKLIDIFYETKNETSFEGTNRDEHYCKNFCPFKDGICDWKDPVINNTNPLLNYLNVVYKL